MRQRAKSRARGSESRCLGGCSGEDLSSRLEIKIVLERDVAGIYRLTKHALGSSLSFVVGCATGTSHQSCRGYDGMTWRRALNMRRGKAIPQTHKLGLIVLLLPQTEPESTKGRRGICCRRQAVGLERPPRVVCPARFCPDTHHCLQDAFSSSLLSRVAQRGEIMCNLSAKPIKACSQLLFSFRIVEGKWKWCHPAL